MSKQHVQASPRARRAVELIARGGLVLWAVVAGAACAPELGPAPANSGVGQSFGEKFFTIACQRVAYASSLRAHELAVTAAQEDPSVVIPPVDVSGSRYRLACRFGPAYLPDSAAEQDPKVATLVKARDPFVQAIDMVFPDEELPALQDYMIRLLPLTDDGTFPDLVQKMGTVLEDLEADAGLQAALARLDGRVGYRPRPVALGLIRELLDYPEIQPTLGQLLHLVGEGGAAHQPFLDLLAALSFELRSAEPVNTPGAPERTLRLAFDLLTSQDDAFAAEPSPVLLVRRDFRGLAAVSASSGGALPAPFIDADGDGLADVDSLGHFRTEGGVAAPEPFQLDSSQPDSAFARDPDGRALDTQGIPVYQYLDLDRTLLAGLARDAKKLFDPGTDTTFQLLLGASGLLGGRVPATKVSATTGESIAFLGFDTVNAPLLDLLYGVFQVLRGPNIDGTLEMAKILVHDHEPAVARATAAALDAKDVGKTHPEAQLTPGSNFWDDLVPYLRQMAVTRKAGAAQSLLEDVIDALADPRTRNLSGILQNFFSYRDVHVLDPNSQAVTNPGFHVPVDRSKPDSGSDRSIMQRILHLVNDANGMRMCNKENACFGVTLLGTDLCLKHFKECDLFEIDNGAVFYAQTVARLRDENGNLTETPKATLRLKTENMPGWLSSIVSTVGEDYLLSFASGIEGFSTHPTAQAVNREMFLAPLPSSLALMVDPAKCIEGHEVQSYHAGTLLAWEQVNPQYSCSANDPCTFIEAFRPLVQAFADHDAEKLLIDMFSVLHKHWASLASKDFQFTDPKAANFSWGSAVVSWEPLVIELLQKGELVNGLCDLAVAVKGTTLADGTPAKTALAQMVQFLLDPALSPGLAYRDGRSFSLESDGKTKVPGGVSPFYLLADAFAAKRKALDALSAGPDQRLAEAWNKSTSDLVDIFLTVEGTGQSRRFTDRRLPVIAQVLVDFLRARLASHDGRGDTAQWLGQELPGDVERVLAGPVLGRAADLLRVLDGQPALKAAIYDLCSYLVNDLGGGTTFRAAITGLADLVQLLLDDEDLVPIAQALGRVLDPARQLTPALLRFAGPALGADSGDACQAGGSDCGADQRCIDLGGGERCSGEMLTHILRNAWKEQSPGKSPVQTLLDLATELHRLKPGAGTPYTGEDFAEAFHQAGDFLVNTETGLVKFFEIVKNRCGGPCPEAGQ